MEATGSLLASTVTSAMPTEELKRYLRGVIAHVAIQTAYTFEHKANLVVSERRIWVGDKSESTISEFNELLDKGLTLVEVLGPAAKGKGVTDVTSFFLYLINDTTADWGKATKTGRLIYKRYDILDFGPMPLMKVA